MNKLLREQIKVNGTHDGDALGAATAILNTDVQPLGGEQRKAMFAFTIASADLDNTCNFDFGVIDDTVVEPALTTELADLNAAGNTIRYTNIGVGGLVNGCHSMSVETVGSADGAITINGEVFPYDAAPAAGTNEWDDEDALVAAINASGLGLTATDVGTVVTIVSTIAGAENIVYSDTVTAIDPGDVIILAYSVIMEIDASEMADGATGVLACIDYLAGTGAATVHGLVIKGDCRYEPAINKSAIQI